MASVALDRRRGNLPAEMTKFIGRKRELGQAKLLLENSRLVTVTGMGGIGKTRLALRVATRQRRSFPDGTWLVELSGLHDPELVAQSVAETLGLSDQSARDRVDLLADHLADKKLLLILDTCEHLIDACAMLVEALLRAAPLLRVLATSQRPLGVAGEHAMQLAPLPVPDPGDPRSVAGQHDVLTLFADRATAVRPDFTLDALNRPAVARLCHRLDGIPLAIELAAVRLRVVSLEQIVERLDDRFRLLGTARTALSRHQTLRAAVEWSHELCTERQRLLWARLSVFAGGFDLEAAEAVCGDAEPQDGACHEDGGAPADAAGAAAGADQGGLPRSAVFETLAGLVERSIVLRTDHPDGARYRMLDTIRDFGADRLAAAGRRGEMRRRHFRYFQRLAARAERQSFSGAQVQWLLRLQRDHVDVRSALEYAARPTVPAADALTMVATLHHFWVVGGHFSEGRHWAGRVLAAHREESLPRVMAVCTAAILATLQGDLDAARPLAAEAKALADRRGDPRARRDAEGVAGMIAFSESAIDKIKKHWEEPALWAEDIADPDVWSATRLAMLAGAYCLAGDIERALAYAKECTDLCERTGERWCLSYALYVQGGCALMSGDAAQAAALVRESLRIKRGFNDTLGIAMTCDVLAGCAIFEGRAERAARLFGAARRIWRTLGAPMFGKGYATIHAMGVDHVREVLGPDAYAAASAEGARLDLDAMIAFALEEEATPPANERRVVAVAAGDPWEPLTKRERDIARLVAEGLANREIAARLVIAKRTVETHVEHILAKLGFSSRVQIAAWAAERRQRSGHDPDTIPDKIR
ncbi:MAG TPA: LuxR C-terminal-related transcriptional regulator [Streptosporangiaceae bacterium]|nr:LuxR C-terminal-related transcriptional regulator [Streptosporangiaceae bacterium]